MIISDLPWRRPFLRRERDGQLIAECDDRGHRLPNLGFGFRHEQLIEARGPTVPMKGHPPGA